MSDPPVPLPFPPRPDDDHDRDDVRPLGRWQDIRLVAARELQTRRRSRALVIFTGITLAFVLAGAILPALLRDDGPATYDIGLVGEATDLAAPLRQLDRAEPDIRFKIRTFGGRDEADRLVEDGEVDVAVVDTAVIVRRSVPQRLAPLLDAAVRSNRVRTAIDAGDVEGSVVGSLTDPEPLKVEPQRASDSATERRSGVMRVGSFLLCAQILGFSLFVAGGVVEEKASRVVEVLLARVRPTDLLVGKVIGLGLLGLGQLLLYVIVGLTVASAVGSVDLAPGWPGAALEILVWFVLGYTFYSCAFAVAGSLVSRQEELRNTSAPLMLLLLVSVMLALGVADDPNGPVAVVGSLLPFSAPLVMPLRTAVVDVALWQMVLAVLLAGAGAVGMAIVADRIYTGGALRFGGRMKLLDAWRGDAATPVGADGQSAGMAGRGRTYRVDGSPPRVATGEHPIVLPYSLDPHPSGPHRLHGPVVPQPVASQAPEPGPTAAPAESPPPQAPRPHPAEDHQAPPYRFDTYPAQATRFDPAVTQAPRIQPPQNPDEPAASQPVPDPYPSQPNTDATSGPHPDQNQYQPNTDATSGSYPDQNQYQPNTDATSGSYPGRSFYEPNMDATAGDQAGRHPHQPQQPQPAPSASQPGPYQSSQDPAADPSPGHGFETPEPPVEHSASHLGPDAFQESSEPRAGRSASHPGPSSFLEPSGHAEPPGEPPMGQPPGNPFGPLANAPRAEPPGPRSGPAWTEPSPDPTYADEAWHHGTEPDVHANGRGRPAPDAVEADAVAAEPDGGWPDDDWEDEDWQELTLPDLVVPELTQVHPPEPPPEPAPTPTHPTEAASTGNEPEARHEG